MKNELLITRKEDRILTLHVEEGRILQAQAEPEDGEGILGNIYIGKVRNIVKNINAAFVEFSKGQMGYLSLDEKEFPIHTGRGTCQRDRVLIGDEIMIQVSRESLKTKPPALTGSLDLTGRYVVLTVGRSQLSISRKIKQKEIRDRLTGIVESYVCEEYGLIVRTNSADIPAEVLCREIQILAGQYEEMMQYGIHKTAFSCLRKAPAGYLCEIRDGYGQRVDRILTDDERLYESIGKYMEDFQPEDKDKLSLWNSTQGKLNAVYNISRTIEHALMPKVWLKSGAYLVIQPTEALVSIDVNTGKAISKKKDVQKTFFKVNKEAALEIAVQLRLRNLSGIILIDFIDMQENEANQELLNILKAAVEKDSVQTVVVDMTKLGLVEVTRKKVRRSLYEQIMF